MSYVNSNTKFIRKPKTHMTWDLFFFHHNIMKVVV